MASALSVSRMTAEYVPASIIIGGSDPVKAAESRGGDMVPPISVNIPLCGDKHNDAIAKWYREHPNAISPNLLKSSHEMKDICDENNCLLLGVNKSYFYSTMSVIWHLVLLAD